MRKHFDFYGYNSPFDGKYFIDGTTYFLGEDFRSVKRYKEYKDVGFNILLLQHTNSYSGEDFETSACKVCMDNAYKAGIDRVIVSDTRLKDLCAEKELVGENGRFKTFNELSDYIDECVAPYRLHPAFYGVQLFDEPQWYKLKAYAIVHKLIQEKGIVPQSNLLNLCAPQMLAENPTNPEKDYEDYLNYFAKNSGCDYLMTDEYPFRRGRSISAYTLPTYEVLAKVCKEHKIELRLVMQSFSQEGVVANANKPGEVEGGVAWRRMTEKDMYYQMNLAMGFGCKEYSFFTYFTKFSRVFNGPRAVSDGIDGAAFINLDGTRTKLYYYTKKVIKEMKQFESVLLNYDFEKAYYFVPKGKTNKDFEVLERIEIKDDCPISVSTKEDPYVVTEMIGKSGGKMFMVENLANTMDELIDGKKAKKVTVNLGKLADGAKFYYKGKLKNIAVNNEKITLKLSAGQALFIETK